MEIDKTKKDKTTGQRIRLKSARDVARYIARCIKSTEAGGDVNLQYKRTMMCSILIKAIDTAELEDRIKTLEKVLERKTNEQ